MLEKKEYFRLEKREYFRPPLPPISRYHRSFDERLSDCILSFDYAIREKMLFTSSLEQGQAVQEITGAGLQFFKALTILMDVAEDGVSGEYRVRMAREIAQRMQAKLEKILSTPAPTPAARNTT
jgi:hypothetical protein